MQENKKNFKVIAGAGGGGGGGGGGGREAADTLQSRAMLSMVDLLGEGQIGGLVAGATSIYLDGTQLQNSDGSYNFQGVSWSFRDGVQDQTPIDPSGGVESPIQVNIRVKKNQPYTVPINNANATQARLVLGVPSLISTDSNGNINGNSVQYQVEMSVDGGPFSLINIQKYWTAGGTAALEGGYNVATRKAGTFGVGAQIAVTGDGSFAITMDYLANGQWTSFGGTVYLNRSSGFDSETGYWTNGTTTTYIQAPEGAEKLRFQVVSGGSQGSIAITAVNSLENSTVGTISGKSRSRYQRNLVINLPKPASQWALRVSRVTDDSTTTNSQNDLYVDSYGEIVALPMSYPNSALAMVTIDSSQVSKIPARSYLVRGLYIRVPSNYNPETREYSGIWDGTLKVAISDNPAWIMYDLITNPRYGLGQFISGAQVDKATLYRIGRYCDEMVPDGYGGTEPRFTINTAIQNQAEAYRLLSDIGSVFRGMTYWNGSMVGFTNDAPSEPSMIFTPANVVDGMFSYSGAARKDRHSVVLVTWNDPQENYKQKVEYIEDPELIESFGVRKVETIAFGCTSRGQAARVGRWILYTEKYESNLISFKVKHDAAHLLPGEVVKIHDTFRAGKRMGGRLLGHTATSARLDAPVELTAYGATISIRLSDGSFADREILEGPGSHQDVTWTEALPVMPVPNAMWVMSEPALKPMLARIISVAFEAESGDYEITAFENNPSKYDAIENGLQLELPKTSILDSRAVKAPEEIHVEEEEYLVAPNVIGTRLSISWRGNEPSYELRWRNTGEFASDWQTVTTTTPSAEIDNVRGGTMEFTLVAMNGMGVRTTPISFSHTVTGRTTAPGDVVNFKVRRRIDDLMLTWDAVSDIGIQGYEVRIGKSWDSGEVLTTRYLGTSLIHDLDAAGVYYYHIRSINSSGQYSRNVSTAQLELLAPLPVSQFDCVQSGTRLEFKWLANPEAEVYAYEIREGEGWSTSQLITQVSATSYTLPAGASGNRTFWIKAIASPGIYSDIPTFVGTAVAQPSNTNVVLEDDQKAAFYPGTRHFVSLVGDKLQMTPGAARSEYLFDVNLPSNYRAQNTLFGNVGAVLFDNMTWADANFSWNSPSANRPWGSQASTESVSARFQVAPRTGMVGKEIDGWRLGSPESEQGRGATAESYGFKYAKGRYGSGLLVDDLTRAAWSINFPLTFNTIFWMIPEEVANSVIWRAEGPAGWLMLRYSTRSNAFELVGSDGKTVKVPFVYQPEDRICIGIAQAPSARRLMIGRMGSGAPVSASEPFVPITAYNKVALF